MAELLDNVHRALEDEGRWFPSSPTVIPTGRVA